MTRVSSAPIASALNNFGGVESATFMVTVFCPALPCESVTVRRTRKSRRCPSGIMAGKRSTNNVLLSKARSGAEKMELAVPGAAAGSICSHR